MCQVQRLKHHPSIILWAGNNENEKGLRQNWFDTDKNFSLYYHDYLQLYVNTIKPIGKTYVLVCMLFLFFFVFSFLQPNLKML